MTKRVDVTLDNCRVCGLRDTFVYTGDDASGDIFSFEVCDRCEQEAYDRMNAKERVDSLMRWTFNDKR
jgi:hypothetical protein